jgi:hypothetical protein
MSEPQDVVGTVELHATFPIRTGDMWDDPDLDANDVLDTVIDGGIVDTVMEAIERGTTTVTVQYRGGEASERTPR